MPKRDKAVAARPGTTHPGPADPANTPPWLVEGSGNDPIPDDQTIAEGLDGPTGDGGHAQDPDGPLPEGEGYGEFNAKTTSNPAPAKKPARARKPAAKKDTPAVAPPGDGTVGDTVPVGADAPGGEEIALHPLDDTEQFLSAMYYGVEGTGKTTDSLAMSLLADPGLVVLINAEGGAKKGALVAMGIDTSRVVMYPKPGQRVTFDGLERLFFQLSSQLDRDPSSVLGVVWDSSTDIVQELLDQVVEEVMVTQAAILERNRGQRPGNIKLRDRFDNDRDDYRRMSNQVRSLLRKYRYLPCHFVVTALMRRDEDETTKKVTYGPAVTPGLQSDLLGYVDMVLHCQVAEMGEGSVYFGTTAPTRTHRGKDRHHVLPTELVNPTFDRLVRYLRGELTPDTDPDQKALAGKPAAPAPVATVRAARAQSGKKKPAPAPAERLIDTPPPVTGNVEDAPPY